MAPKIMIASDEGNTGDLEGGGILMAVLKKVLKPQFVKPWT
jgi:hypothetical protein